MANKRFNLCGSKQIDPFYSYITEALDNIGFTFRISGELWEAQRIVYNNAKDHGFYFNDTDIAKLEKGIVSKRIKKAIDKEVKQYTKDHGFYFNDADIAKLEKGIVSKRIKKQLTKKLSNM